MALTLGGLLLLVALLSLTSAQEFGRSLSETLKEPDVRPPLSEENGKKLFEWLISKKSEKQQEAYHIQHNRLLSNQTLANLLVKLRGSETLEEEENESFFEPFFQWVLQKKEEKYRKIERVKKRGVEKMAQKMDEWGLTGILQSFFGVETGVSVLNVDCSKLDMMTAWTTVLADPDVEFVDLDMGVDLLNDCNLRSDWGYHQIRADTATELLGFEGDDIPSDGEVLVAVIDSGVDYTHPLLEGRIWVNRAELRGRSGVDDDGNGLIDDIYGWNFASNNNDVIDTDGHGTHVAGIIAGRSNRRPRFSGVAPNAIILPCRFTESPTTGTISAAIQCIEYSLEMGADVISNSWGGAGAFSLALEEAMIRAQRKGRLQIIAAGNSAVNNDGPKAKATFPASFDTEIIISVAAIGGDASLTEISNFGRKTTDIAAPGHQIVSTRLDGKLARMSGTSQAAPFVAGAVALLLGACRHQGIRCPASAIKRALLQGAERSPDLRGVVRSAGYLDIPNAARRLGVANSNVSIPINDIQVCNSASSLHPISLLFILFTIISALLLFQF